MEERKQKEIEYYDKEASEAKETKEAGSLANFDPMLLESYRFLFKSVKEKGKGKKILDYGCGTGVHLKWLSEIAEELTAIDLSKKSLEVAEKRIEGTNNIKLLEMDCENLAFSDNSFDIVFDGGTFSSLDFEKSLKEIKRVLRPDGYLIGIETFGHNPITNLKRKLNTLLGKRTGWAAEHILKMKDIETAKKYFREVEVRFFHVISWAGFPFANLPGGRLFLRFLESVDHLFPFLKRYSFKIVFILKK